MPTGMDMLVASVLKAAGIDPEKAKADLANYGQKLGEKIASLDASLVALRADQAQTYAAVIAIAEQVTQAAARVATEEFLDRAVKEDGRAANRH